MVRPKACSNDGSTSKHRLIVTHRDCAVRFRLMCDTACSAPSSSLAELVAVAVRDAEDYDNLRREHSEEEEEEQAWALAQQEEMLERAEAQWCSVNREKWSATFDVFPRHIPISTAERIST